MAQPRMNLEDPFRDWPPGPRADAPQLCGCGSACGNGAAPSSHATSRHGSADAFSDSPLASHTAARQLCGGSSTRGGSTSGVAPSSREPRFQGIDDAGYTWLAFTDPENGAWWW